MHMSLFKKGIAEFVGTLVLVFVSCGVAALTGVSSTYAAAEHIVATALAFGLSIVAMAYTIGKVSGCHINPAVSLAMLINKKMTLVEFFVYVGAQILGAIAGAALLQLVFINHLSTLGGLGTDAIQQNLMVRNPDYSIGTDPYILNWASYLVAFVVELVLTFIFVLVVLGATEKAEESNIAGIVIGLALTFVHLIGIPLTGTSVNPARSIGPALIALANGYTEPAKELWIFILAPLAGGALAAFFWKFLMAKKADKEAKKSEVKEAK